MQQVITRRPRRAVRVRTIALSAAVGIAALLTTAAPSFASIWAPNNGDRVDVCFEADGLSAIGAEQLVAAAGAWNAATTNLNVTAGECGSEYVVPVTPGQLGDPLARTSWAGDPKIMAKIEVDIENTLSLGNSNDASAWRTVLCHEMGHALGLFNNDRNIHSDDPTSCMQTSIRKPFPYPADSDLEELRDLYGGSAKTRALSAAPATQSAQVGQPSQPTAPVRRVVPRVASSEPKRGRIVDSGNLSAASSRVGTSRVWEVHAPIDGGQAHAYQEWTNRFTPKDKGLLDIF